MKLQFGATPQETAEQFYGPPFNNSEGKKKYYCHRKDSNPVEITIFNRLVVCGQQCRLNAHCESSDDEAQADEEFVSVKH